MEIDESIDDISARPSMRLEGRVVLSSRAVPIYSGRGEICRFSIILFEDRGV